MRSRGDRERADCARTLRLGLLPRTRTTCEGLWGCRLGGHSLEGCSLGGEDETSGDEVGDAGGIEDSGGAGGVKDSGGDNVVFAKRSLLSLGPALLAMPGEAIELLAAPPSAIIGRHAQVIGAFFVRGIMVYDLETEFGTLRRKGLFSARAFHARRSCRVRVQRRLGYSP